MSVVIHDDFWQAAQSMPERQRPAFIYAVCAYAFDGTEPEGTPAWLPTFIVVRDRIEMSSRKSERGRAMANARWHRQDAQADAQAHAQACTAADADAAAQDVPTHDAEKEKEKEEEKKDRRKSEPTHEQVTAIVSFLNRAAHTRYQTSTAKTKSLIAARMREGFTVTDFKEVIAKKCAEWMGTDMERYLRPETLFGPKFEGYLNDNTRTAKGGGDYAAYD